VELTFATLSYDDAQSQKAVLLVVELALKQELFLKTFAGALVRYDGIHTSPQVRNEHRNTESNIDRHCLAFQWLRLDSQRAMCHP